MTRRARKSYADYLATPILVNLTTGKAFKGVLWAASRDLLVLRGAEVIEGNASPQSVDGEAVIERDRIDFVQVLPHGAA